MGFVLIFGLLILPWPGWNQGYGQAFCAVGNAIFKQDNPRCLLYFELYRETHGLSALDSQIVIKNRQLADDTGKGPVTTLGLDSRSIGWVPTALTLALIIATPIPWRRRSWALLGGMFLVHAFILISIAIYIWNESTSVSLFALSPFWKQIADGLEYTLITQLGASFSVPVLIWILVSLRREDVSSLRL